VAVGAWLMVERGAPAGRIAERSAVLFLYTSAINVITLILAGLGLFLGLPGPRNPLLSIVPAAVGAVVLVLFLILPRYVDSVVRRLRPGRLHTLLTETAASVRDTKRLTFHPDWRIVGAIGYAAFVPVLQRMHHAGTTISDVLADSGYSYRFPETWALPLRALGIDLICDLHPNDRGPHGTHHGATSANGRLYCPATPKALLELGPLPRAASTEHTALRDAQCAELARYKLSPITRPDPQRLPPRRLPRRAGQAPLPPTPRIDHAPTRPADRDQPTRAPARLLHPAHDHRPPTVNAKTAQKHDYPSPAHRTSYNRRTAAERTFATLTDGATTDLSRGWCRQMGLTANALHIATELIARNIRVADTFTNRQLENQRRADRGLPPRTRTRRRTTIHDLVATAHAP
jgi:hypothetical protein